jgi:hypothetical protein
VRDARNTGQATWNGLTATDLVFPTFVFVMGILVLFAIEGRLAGGATRRQLVRHALQRAVILPAWHRGQQLSVLRARPHAFLWRAAAYSRLLPGGVALLPVEQSRDPPVEIPFRTAALLSSAEVVHQHQLVDRRVDTREEHRAAVPGRAQAEGDGPEITRHCVRLAGGKVKVLQTRLA